MATLHFPTISPRGNLDIHGDIELSENNENELIAIERDKVEIVYREISGFFANYSQILFGINWRNHELHDDNDVIIRQKFFHCLEIYTLELTGLGLVDGELERVTVGNLKFTAPTRDTPNPVCNDARYVAREIFKNVIGILYPGYPEIDDQHQVSFDHISRTFRADWDAYKLDLDYNPDWAARM